MHGNDIEESLRTKVKTDTSTWSPTLEASHKTDAAEKELEDEQFNMECKEELDLCMKRKNSCKDILHEAFAEIWERCSIGMKEKLESRSYYERDIFNKPIKLLETIKEHSLSYEESQYDMKILTKAIRNYVNCKQDENESLINHTKKVKAAIEVLTTHLGSSIVVREVVENDYGCVESNAEAIKKISKKIDERLAAYLCLENSDFKKHGEMMKTLTSQQLLKNDRHPKTILNATSVLSQHRWDNGHEKKKNSRKNDENTNESYKDEKEHANNLSFAQSFYRCMVCGDRNHAKKECPKLKK